MMDVNRQEERGHPLAGPEVPVCSLESALGQGMGRAGTGTERRASRRTFFLVRIWRFYRDGFQAMTWGKTLWLVILVKLFIMFAILKVFFFPDFLKGKTETEKQDYVGTELVGRGLDNLENGF